MTTKISRSPVSFQAVKRMYDNNPVTIDSQRQVFDQVEKVLSSIRIPGEFAKRKDDKDLIDLYCEYRSWVLFSEGLNKIWTTVELHKKNLDGELKLKEFNIWFSNSSTIPVLHYANISLLMSFITALGLVPRRVRDKELFLVRQRSSYFAVERKEYVKQCSIKVSDKNWHEIIIRVSEDTSRQTKFQLQFDQIDCVRRARNFLDYQILAKDALILQAGEKDFANCLKVSISLASDVFNFLTSNLGLEPRNRAEVRYRVLAATCNEIIENYSSKSSGPLDKEVPCLAKMACVRS